MATLVLQSAQQIATMLKLSVQGPTTMILGVILLVHAFHQIRRLGLTDLNAQQFVHQIVNRKRSCVQEPLIHTRDAKCKIRAKEI